MTGVAERSITQRTYDTVAGLSAGDAVTWSSWWHRMAKLGPRRAVRLGEARDHAREAVTTTIPTPYLHASSPELIDPAGPTDDTEWFVVGVRHLLGQRLDGTPTGEQHGVWAELAALRAEGAAAVRARIGTSIALDNLQRGAYPPVSGHDNPHYFDDIACVRAVAAGLLRPGDASAAAGLAATDAAVTHALDGVWGARATATLVALLAAGGDRQAAVDAALRELPAGSWIAHVVSECLSVVEPAATPVDLGARLERAAVDHVYSYANQAPESLGLVLAHLSVADSFDAMLLGALCHPRHADGLVPLAGAVAGAAFGGQRRDLPTLKGVCVRDLDGVSLDSVVHEIIGGQETV